jgi:hypothetical protein
MIFESVFLVRGGSGGYDWGLKFIISLIAIIVCIYDYKVNERRLDYFWVFLTGTIIWGAVELSMQLTGGRVLQEKYFFGLNVTSMLWFTIPIQGMAEAGAIAIMGMYFGDRIMSKEARKKNVIIFALFLLFFLLMLRGGISYDNVDVGGKVPSRREMFSLNSVIGVAIIISPAIYWLIKTDSEVRKRGLYMILIMTIWAFWWNFLSWLTGQRWIEVGTKNSDGTYSNLHRADDLLEFWAFVYNSIFEIVLVYAPFLAIPYLLGLIKSNEAKN